MISDQQRRALVDSMKQVGNLAYASAAAGLTVTQARGLLQRDEDLRRELADAEELHKGFLYHTALTRATTGGSDVLLGKLLDARVDEFDKDAKKAKAMASAKPSSITLRGFTADANGEVQDVDSKPLSPDRSDSPGAPLQLDYVKGL